MRMHDFTRITEEENESAHRRLRIGYTLHFINLVHRSTKGNASDDMIKEQSNDFIHKMARKEIRRKS